MVSMKFDYGNSDRGAMIGLICGIKAAALEVNKRQYRVIDIGASDNPWSAPFVDATLDLKSNNLDPDRVKSFIGDINVPSGWLEVMTDAELNGKFDYAICTHTLEDVINPEVALKILPHIAKAGFIAMPSYHREMTRNLEGPWKGYIHHRWIFKQDGDALLLIPKIPYVEFLPDHSGEDHDKAEIRIYWKGGIDYKILNGGYLGPNVHYVKAMYEEALK